MKSLKTLAENLNPIQIIGDIDFDIYNVCYNSKLATSNSLFCAIVGNNTDGHLYINSAISNGATVIVCQELPDIRKAETTYIKVKNTREALAKISHAFYDYPAKGLKIIGITGTNGKTSTSFILKTIFEEAQFSTGIIGTTGIYIGEDKIESTHTTPESLEIAKLLYKMKEAKVTHVVMEVSSHALHQNRIDCIDFNIAIFTNLSQDHLDYHETMDNYANAKKILFDNLSPKSLAIVNGDDEYTDIIVKDTAASIIHVGSKESRNKYKISNIFQNFNGLRFDLDNEKESTSFHSKLIGKFNVQNLSFCIAAAISLKIPLETIQYAISTTDGAIGRMNRIPLKNGAIAIIDFAHSPDSLEKAIQNARELLNSGNKLVTLFGCGGERDNTKRPIMGKIASELSDFVIISDDNPRGEDPMTIINEILSGIESQDKIHIQPNRKLAISQALNMTHRGDIVLIAGKGHEEYQIYKAKKTYFSDFDEVNKWNK